MARWKVTVTEKRVYEVYARSAEDAYDLDDVQDDGEFVEVLSVDEVEFLDADDEQPDPMDLSKAWKEDQMSKED